MTGLLRCLLLVAVCICAEFRIVVSQADVAFEMPEDSVTEGDSSISVCVHLVDGALTSLGQILMISSREQEALAPQDYLPVSTEVTFNADEETRMCRDVTIRDDFILEGEETFLLEITTTAPELTIVAPVTIRITIEDNDELTVDFPDRSVTVPEGSAGTKTAVSVCLRITDLPRDGVERDVQFSLSVDLDTAEDDDFATPDPEMVTFSVPVDDGDSKCIDYLIVGDYIKEEDEIFTVSASALNGVKANIMNTFSVTIQDHVAMEPHTKPLPIWLWPLIAGQKARDGLEGEKGQKGWQGLPGETGPQGPKGTEEGEKGDKGDMGATGEMGDTGPRGATGEDGEQGEDGMPGNDVIGTGVVYTRWGRTTCPSDAETLTAGLAASPYHYDTGGGANYMCLPDEPQFVDPNTNVAVQTKVVGVKYKTLTEPLFELNDMAMPCAVCYTNRATQLMILGRAVCPTNWNLEYNGYLMSAKDSPSNTLESDPDSNNFRTEFICVEDTDTEGLPAGANEEAGIYHVHIDCDAADSLNNCASSGYSTASQLTCAVCTYTPPTGS